MQDPELKQLAMEMFPKFMNIVYKSNELDDLIVFKINELIKKEENEGDWFLIDHHTRILAYKPLNTINHIDGSAWTTKLYGTNSNESILNSNLIRNSLHEYRNDIISSFADEVKNYNNEDIFITYGDLVSYDFFESHLMKTGHPWKDDLLKIYNLLSIPEFMVDSGVAKKWNIYTFNNHSLIGSISTFTFLIKEIKEAQNIAGNILVNEVIYNSPRL